jgi:hypothetical protein
VAGDAERCRRRRGLRRAFFLSTDGRFRGFPVTPGIADSVEDFVNNGWELGDERLRGVSALRTKAVIADEDCLSKEAQGRSTPCKSFFNRGLISTAAGV